MSETEISFSNVIPRCTSTSPKPEVKK